ncbi:MAG: tRNA (adenosine(37)-N6)-dimethylallyltransferase MiaA [Candidatus Portnoybacteria bacterium CG10_big_fil_rev_8_21_14_0_10_44_7]|uniref:tRNA dimethylallyltransferase n=1 Tax=Candidatus Portnoybacteria bacterium CG10_big_fil_rev_8_21_14_0_10_44_7 TaxID=1974816 RepID=A0A2M8KIW0_9BACT|nr:MAG: tRNA (adenosine(37)-N6)-dimethylallyltransferase MiaA [Candidatus Portnoybacteria bacterium CG10_big_fil_rev_8_21_14_0_10_44_7]
MHLPVQSGNNTVLKKMNRHYTAAQYKKLVKKIKAAFKKYRSGDLPLALTTDIIVGFSGETEKQFADSARLMKEVAFDMAYLSCYYPRPGTAAARLADNVSYKRKRVRENALNEVLKKTALKNNKYYLQKTVDVLVAGIKNGYAFGHTKTQKNVKAKINGPVAAGDIIKVRIDQVLSWHLAGRQVKPKLIVIVGPNSAGKTSLSIGLAKKFDGEVISADSRQVYQRLDIGSGKVTKKEMGNIPHYLLDVCHPKEVYTVAHFKEDADVALKQIYAKNKIPLLVGGTGFFIDAVVQNLEIPPVKPDKKLRQALERKTASQLFAQLKKLDSQRAQNIDPQNRRRLIRSIEIAKALGSVPPTKAASPFDVLYLGVWREKDELKKRIHVRLLQRINEGMIEEVKNLRKLGLSWRRLDDLGLEYRYISYYLTRKIDYAEMLGGLERAIWRFAKRQWTWFKRNRQIHWIKKTGEAEKLVKRFLSSKKLN